jgi:uncharacterized protein YajQ (UPF0234 family)
LTLFRKSSCPKSLTPCNKRSKEIQQRYDLKDSHSSIQLNEKDNKLLLASADEFKLKAVVEILEQKLVNAKSRSRDWSTEPVTPAAGSSVRPGDHAATGHPIEKAREIVKAVKDSKKKCQVSIQGDFLRVSAKDRDTLQEVIALLARARTSASTCSSPTTAATDAAAASNRFSWTDPSVVSRRFSKEPEEGEPLGKRRWSVTPIRSTGGTMHNKVVYRIARGLRRAGAVVLRFNFRGVNQSAGSYGEGEGELDDARVAHEVFARRYPDLPYTLAGFSFGSRVAFRSGAKAASTSTNRGRVSDALPSHVESRDLPSAANIYSEHQRRVRTLGRTTALRRIACGA